MSGLTDLQQTLQSLKVICDDIQYSFSSVADESQIDRNQVLATFHEMENLQQSHQKYI